MGLPALLYTDVVDSTRTTQRLGDEVATRLWMEHDSRARRLLPQYHGREIGRSDGFLILFQTADDAVRYARHYHAQLADIGIVARVALHVGPVVMREASDEEVSRGALRTDVEGFSVSVAARVMAMASGGQTLLTSQARRALHAVEQDPSLETRSHGYYRLKGVDEPLEIFEVGIPGQSGFLPPPDADKSYRVVREGELWIPVRDIARRIPSERDAFIGRAGDLARVATRFAGGTRLVSLLGAGGSGKTRLAVRYGRSWLGDWPGGVWFCDLSDAISLDGICYEVGRTLGIRLGTGEPVMQLAEAIASRGRCLVILDNFEQVVEHAPDTIGRWLDASEAAFLVTTRERLSIPGEVVQEVEPLPLDGPATELFMVRARAANEDFPYDVATRGLVDQAVEMLDGMPLAIELAAALVPTLSPAALVEGLRDRFAVLGGRRGPGRQATLRAAIEWSWALLAPWEQVALAQCAIFEGGFTASAAEAVVDLGAWPQAPGAAEVVTGLARKSLLRRFTGDGPPAGADAEEARFGMYISIQEYARERMHAMGEEAVRTLEERHGRCFASFGSDAALEALSMHGSVLRHRALRLELDNLVAGARRAIARGEADVAVACYRASWEVISMQGPFGLATGLGEGILRMQGLDVRLAALARLTHVEVQTRTTATDGMEASLLQVLEQVRLLGDRLLEGRILGKLGNLCLWASRLEEAYDHYLAALAAVWSGGTRLLEARMLGNLAITAHERGRTDEAAAHYQAALEIEREIGSQRDEAITSCNYADLLGSQGKPDAARAAFTRALALLRDLGDRDTEAVTLQQMGEYEIGEGMVYEGLETLQHALDLARGIGNRRVEGYALLSLAGGWIQTGQFDKARAALEEVLTGLRQAPNQRMEGLAVLTLGDLAFREGRVEEAIRLLARSEATLRAQGDKFILAELLCVRGVVDASRGEAEPAAAALSEAGAIAAEMNMGEASKLGRHIGRLRAAVALSQQ